MPTHGLRRKTQLQPLPLALAGPRCGYAPIWRRTLQISQCRMPCSQRLARIGNLLLLRTANSPDSCQYWQCVEISSRRYWLLGDRRGNRSSDVIGNTDTEHGFEAHYRGVQATEEWLLCRRRYT